MPITDTQLIVAGGLVVALIQTGGLVVVAYIQNRKLNNLGVQMDGVLQGRVEGAGREGEQKGRADQIIERTAQDANFAAGRASGKADEKSDQKFREEGTGTKTGVAE